MTKASWGTILFLLVQCAVVVLCVLSARPDVHWDAWGRHEKQYEELTEAFLHGRLSLTEAPAAFLSEMENPYDPVARSVAAAEHDAYALIDVSYYNNRYYVYFGVLPVITAFLPIRLLTGHIPPTWAVILIYGVLYVLISWLFLTILNEVFYAGRVKLPWRMLFCAVWVASTGTPYLTSFAVTYSLPSMAGLCYTVLGLCAWMTTKEVHGRYRVISLIAGSVCLALTCLCRPLFTLATLLAFPLFSDEIRDGYFFRLRKDAALHTFAVIGPYLLLCSLYFTYNFLRFGHPLESGYSYLLTVSDLTSFHWSFEHFRVAFTQLLVQPLNLDAAFPFLHGIDLPDSAYEAAYLEPVMGGFFTFNLVGLTAFSVFFLRGDTDDAAFRCARRTAICALVLAAVVLFIDCSIAGVSVRYQYDFGYLVMLGAVVMGMGVTTGGRSFASLRMTHKRDSGITSDVSPAWARLLRIVVIALCVLCIVFNYLAVFSDGRYFAMRETNPEVYEILQRIFSGIQ